METCRIGNYVSVELAKGFLLPSEVYESKFCSFAMMHMYILTIGFLSPLKMHGTKLCTLCMMHMYFRCYNKPVFSILSFSDATEVVTKGFIL